MAPKNSFDLTNRRTLAKMISLIESQNYHDQLKADTLLKEIYEELRASTAPTPPVIAITGTPGAGKSTFIDTFGTSLADQGLKIAVLAVDPSSPLSGGAILGDKTRMTKLANHPNAFVRPCPSGAGNLGGLSPATEDALWILKASQFDYIFIETIGVGQNEFDVRLLADLVLMFISPTSGDELQGIKKGNLEYIDHLIVNKFDGASKEFAVATADEYRSALKGTPISVLLCSALEQIGFDKIIALLNKASPHTLSRMSKDALLPRRLASNLLQALLTIDTISDLYKESQTSDQPTRLKAKFFTERLKKLLTSEQNI